ncbi:hypothetical protein FCIRC_6154 [Fusarium circinatum]|uniref:Uncharacterized protein n=1 Tax=Fusarium circinatum TaxID=48490 RepID=A0A8H5X310_FUSCI|nr:hypothetical protein FCIRC_6154 [Fusarium circinatum]
MKIIYHNPRSTEGHALPPSNAHGIKKPVKNSSGEVKTEKSAESVIFHLEAAWGSETMDLSLKVGAAGFALILALALLALIALAKAFTFTTYMTRSNFWVVVTMLALLLVILDVARGLADARSGK